MKTAILLAALLVGCVLFVAAIVYVAMHAVREHTRRREELWRAFAESCGGFLVPASGSFLFRRPASIVVPHGPELAPRASAVTIDLYVVSTGKSSTTYTRARARFALGFGPSFRVSSEGLVSAVGKALGAMDLSLDDLAFDARFVVKGESLAAIRVAWSPPARQAALSFDRPRVTSNGVEITALVLGARVHDHELRALVTIVGELACYRIAELAGLARAVGATFQTPAGLPPALRFATSRGEVEAGLSREGLVMKLPDTRGLPELHASLSNGDAQGLPRGLLTDDSRVLVPRVGTCRLATGGGFVWLTWPGVPDAQTFRAGAQLLSELAGGDPSRGAFR